MSPNLLNVLLVLLPFVLYFGYLNPKYTGDTGFLWTPEKSIKSLQVENVQYTNAINQITEIQSQSEAIVREYKKIPEEDKQKIETLLPDNLDPIKLRSEVIAIAAKSGVALSGLKVDLDQKEKGAYIVSFTLNSRYDQFKEMIESYEKSTRLFVADKVSIQRPQMEGGTTKIQDVEALSITLSFRVYFKK